MNDQIDDYFFFGGKKVVILDSNQFTEQKSFSADFTQNVFTTFIKVLSLATIVIPLTFLVMKVISRLTSDVSSKITSAKDLTIDDSIQLSDQEIAEVKEFAKRKFQQQSSPLRAFTMPAHPEYKFDVKPSQAAATNTMLRGAYSVDIDNKIKFVSILPKVPKVVASDMQLGNRTVDIKAVPITPPAYGIFNAMSI